MKRATRATAGKFEFQELPSKPKRKKKTIAKTTKIPVDYEDQAPANSIILEQGNYDENSNEVVDPQVLKETEVLGLIRQIFGFKYFDVKDRLKLDWTPSCVKDYSECERHQKERDWTEADYFGSDMARTLLFTNSNQHSKGLILFEDLVMNKVFPYCDIFQDLIKFILTTRKPEEHTVSEIQLLFCNLLNTFPPCQIRDYYVKFLTESIDVPKYVPSKKSASTTIIEFILTHIESSISDQQEFDREGTAGELQDNINSSELLNFSDWELKQETEHFDLLSRSQKLERLFSSLDLIVRLFEADTAIWMLKYPKDVSNNLFNDDTQPLILKALKMNKYKLSSILVKTTLKVFSDLIAFDYPDFCKDVFSRLISLISNVMNLSEIGADSEETVEFPYVGSRTADFAKELFKACDYNNIQLYFRALNFIKIPYIKYLFIDEIITKVFRKQIKLKSPDDILQSVLNKNPLWFQLNLRPEEMDQDVVSDGESGLFPLVTKVKVKKSVEFFREDYMNLTLISMESFCDTFEVKRCCFLFSESRKKLVIGELESSMKADFINIPSNAYFLYGREYLKSYAILYNKIDYLERKCEVNLGSWKKFLFDNV